jgi:hypothetical protein
MNLQETTGSLDPQKETFTTLNKDEEVFYFIDFSKLKNVEDLVTVLASMGFGLSNKHFQFENIKQFLDLDRPVRTH